MTIAKEMIEERVRRVQVHKHVQEKTARAGFGGLSIQRTPLGTHIRISAERPGLVIGRKGGDIQNLTDELERKFGYENLQVEAGEVHNFALNPLIMSAKVANALERGWNYRRAGNSMLQRIMDSGARGCQITIAGKLTGLRHRTEKFVSGHIRGVRVHRTGIESFEKLDCSRKSSQVRKGQSEGRLPGRSRKG